MTRIEYLLRDILNDTVLNAVNGTMTINVHVKEARGKHDMRTNKRQKPGINDTIEPHRDENAEDWTKNLGFGRKVQLINKAYGFSGRHKR